MQLTLVTSCLILAMFSFAVVAGFLVSRKSGAPLRERLLAGFLLAMTLTALNFFLFASGLVRQFPSLAYIGNTLGLGAAPFLFLYAKSLAVEGFAFSRTSLWHFSVVALVLVIVVAAYTSKPQTAQLSILFDSNEPSIMNSPILQVSIFLFVFVYLAKTIRILAAHQHRFKEFHSGRGLSDLLWLRIAVIGGFWVWTGSLIHQLVIGLWPVAWIDRAFANLLAVSAFFFGLYFLINALRQTAQPSMPVPAAGDEKYGDRRLSDETLQEFSTIIEAHLEQSKAHLSGSLSLDELAEALPMTSRELSQTLNGYYGKSFFEFINDSRIRHALTRLKADPSTSITDIMMECGFSSKSSFYAAFRKATGQTPTQFRRATTPGPNAGKNAPQ